MLKHLALLTLLIAPSAHANPTEPLRPFFEDLAAIKAAKTGRHVRIAWYGDSAIVSDGYTGVVRQRLQARFGDAGPGFILAAPTFDGYLRTGVRLKRTGWTANNVISGELESGRYGYGGIVASGFGGASATFEPKKPVHAIEVFFEGQKKGGRIEILTAGAKDPVAIIETADKGSEIHRHVFSTPAKDVKIRIAGGPAKVYGVVLEAADRGIQLDAIGVLGLRARRWLNADKAHLTAQIAARKPDLIVLNFGGNERVDPGLSEKAHKADIVKTLDALRAGQKDASCLIVGPLAHGVDKDGKIALDANLDAIYAAQRAAAADAGCAFFDTIEAMGGKKKALKTWKDKRWLSGDYAHLTNKGHEELGRLLADWLDAGFDAAVTRHGAQR